MTAKASAGPPAPSPAVRAEAGRQLRLLLHGSAFGDAETRRSMERELHERLLTSLQTQTPLRVYMGVDPTAPDLHLGHCVGLRKLRVVQELGHHAILLIGDFTGLVGDPSDKDALRPMRGQQELDRSARTYQEQAFKLLDPAGTEVRRNSEWLGALTFTDVVHLASNFTVAQFLERDTFRQRLDRKEPVYVHEFLYGLMQAQDAVALKADVQIGGTEQTFNIMAGRILQRTHEQPPQVALTFPILVGLDGTARMSKSTGNYIGIDEPPDDQYGKAMSIPDAVLPDYFTLATNLSPEDVDAVRAGLDGGTLHPMDAKKRLAHAIVAEWHGGAQADAAAVQFARVFSQREIPAEMPETTVGFDGDAATINLPNLLTDAGLVASKAKVKRLLNQGGIQLDGERVDTPEIRVHPGAVLKVGKRRWLRIVSG